MMLTLSVAAYLLKVLAGMSLLTLVLSWLKQPRDRLPILKTVDGRQLWLVVAACLAWILGSGANAWNEYLEAEASLALSQGPDGALVQKATPAALRVELTRAPSGLDGQANDGFEAGERDLAAMRYREAAWNYERSVRAVPTVAGYLNLGVALLCLSEFQRAESALLSGLLRARQEAADRTEGAYLDALGRAYLGQGRLQAALESHRAALEVHTRVGNPVGRANAHANIGDVLLAQGKLGEALLSHREAFRLYTRLENLIGRANALNRIGSVYIRLQEPEEALGALQEALSLNRRIGNPLGQASDLAGISSAYLAQGKPREALEALRQSQALYRQLGLAVGSGPNGASLIGQTKAAGAAAP
jgi:tetratricopeptide (TPR) repeat protein